MNPARRSARRSPRSALAAWLLAATLAPASVPTALAQEDLEVRVKAAYLFNFARFVTWPAAKLEGPNDPIRICIFGSRRFADVVGETVAGKTIAEHPIEALPVARADDLVNCHIVYLDESAGAAYAGVLHQLAGSGVLTVHEAAAPQHNGVVRFFIEDRKVRFEINTRAAEREDLQLSAKLLGVARVVQE